MRPQVFCTAALSLVLTACGTVSEPVRADLLGTVVPDTAVARSIVIGPDTRSVNVTGGEIIRFIVGERSFGYSFDGSLTVTRFDLRRVAPAGLLLQPVTAYIARNPLYTGGDNDGGR